MEIIVGQLSGFCFGVNNAVTKALELIENKENVYCLGELIHNKGINANLEKHGVKIVEKIEEVPCGAKLIIRAHGVPPEVYEKARNNQNELYDYTCPNVIKIHNQIEEKRQNNYIFILGGKKHPETIGHKGFSRDKSFIIETEDDIEEAISRLKNSKMKSLYIVAQTTFSVTKFEKIVNEISKKLNGYEIEINKSICAATQNRQAEAEELSKKVDYMIIIGGKNSANTIKLYEISKQNCPSIHIENKDELNLEEIKKYNKIGITAGASTPKENIQEVLQILEEIK